MEEEKNTPSNLEQSDPKTSEDSDSSFEKFSKKMMKLFFVSLLIGIAFLFFVIWLFYRFVIFIVSSFWGT